jgi:hypothetical protein
MMVAMSGFRERDDAEKRALAQSRLILEVRYPETL